MPTTRRQIDRDKKVDELLNAAERQVLAGGYAALSVAGIARELGLAQNSVYWYFGSKDELFVAVLKRLLARVAVPDTLPAGDPTTLVLQVIDNLGELQWLRASLRERARESAVVAAFEQEFRELLRTLLRKALGNELPAAKLATAVDAFMATVDGAFAHGLDAKRRRRMLRFAIRRLFAPEP